MAPVLPCQCNHASAVSAVKISLLRFSIPSKLFPGPASFRNLRSLPRNRILLRAAEGGKIDVSNPDGETLQNLKAAVEDADISVDESLVRRIASAKDAAEALIIMSDSVGNSGNCVVSRDDCRAIISAAFSRNNPELALSILDAMRRPAVNPRIDLQDENPKQTSFMKLRWSRPDSNTYATVVLGLITALKVSSAINVIKDMACMGSPRGYEVTFGKVVDCPYCMVPIAIVLPEEGVQLASCSKCRYQYEFVSGDVVSIESEIISGETSIIRRSLRFVQIDKKPVPAAIHLVAIKAPNGLYRKYRFGTESIDVPAQTGERVSLALAAPPDSRAATGLLNLSARTPGRKPGEPMCITNHASGFKLQLIPAPPNDGRSRSFGLSFIVPAIAVVATADVAMELLDPSFPKLMVSFVTSAFILGTTFNKLVLPKLSQLSQNEVDNLVVKHKLLEQYDYIQSRLNKLVQSAEEEVWMLARLCYLENKIETMGELSYSARKSRVQSARRSLEESVVSRLKLTESYAKLASMIEIELELDKDVMAAELVTETEHISERIEQLLELENLELQWKIQTQANDEIEKLLQSAPALPESV